jgi:hypothetical protein
MGTTAPRLTAAQMARIEHHLPAKRRDRDIISALLFRRWSGAGLRPTANWYGCTFGRLQSWETQLRAGGQLTDIMRELHFARGVANDVFDWRRAVELAR